MNWGKTILSIFIIYGLIGLVLAGVGSTLKTEPGLGEIAVGINATEYSNQNDIQSYMDTVVRAGKRAGMDEFRLEKDYGLSDKITVFDIWVSDESIGSYKGEVSSGGSWWDVAYDTIRNMLSGKPFTYNTPSYDRWKDKSRSNLSYGENVYIYPHFAVNLDKDFVNIWRYVVVQGWDVNGNRWFTNMWTYEPWVGGTYDIVAELNGGKMPKTDLFYCIDYIVSDTDIKDYFQLQSYLQIGKAEVVERSGGMIAGDIHLPIPTQMRPHTLSKTPNSGFSGFIDILGNVGIAYNAFQGYGVISLLINIILFAPIGIISAYMIYTEARSWIPFISGG